jgi:hypothetical protein
LTDWAQLEELLASEGDQEHRFEHIDAWARHWPDRLA